MSKERILVVEDESIVSRDIQQSLKRLGYEIVGTADNSEKAIDIARSERPDLILMDIMLKGDVNGITTAEIIKNELSIPIIFLTAYADDATLSKAKVTEPQAYLIKPFKEQELHSAIEMAIYKHTKEQEVIKERDLLYSLVEGRENGPDFIFVKSNSKLVRIDTNDIQFVEALKDYVVINCSTQKYTIHSTMKEIENKLGATDFIRVHRSYIVRMDKIAAIEYPNLVLDNGKKQIPIGGSYRDDLNKRIKQL